MPINNRQMEAIVRALKWIYLALPVAVVPSLVLIYLAEGPNGTWSPSDVLITDALALYFLVVSGGLSTRASWLVPLILSGSGVFVLLDIRGLLMPAAATAGPLRLVRILGLAFYAFQINFFTRKEVRSYFRSVGGTSLTPD